MVKRGLMVLTILCLLNIGVGVVLAQTAASSADVDYGRKLFNEKGHFDAKYACIMCHKEDKAVKKDKVAEAGDSLPDVINKYIVEKAKGTAIAKDSPEMKALIAYIKTEHAI